MSMTRYLPCLLLSLFCGAVFAEPQMTDWANWRGPNYDGSSTVKNLPAKLDDSTQKWKIDLPGPSAATPIVYGDHVFITVADEAKDALLGVCVNHKTGKTEWSKNLGSGYQAGGDGTKTKIDSRSNYASPSAVTDGEVLFLLSVMAI